MEYGSFYSIFSMAAMVYQMGSDYDRRMRGRELVLKRSVGSPLQCCCFGRFSGSFPPDGRI